jgi:hypothetical protein
VSIGPICTWKIILSIWLLWNVPLWAPLQLSYCACTVGSCCVDVVDRNIMRQCCLEFQGDLVDWHCSGHRSWYRDEDERRVSTKQRLMCRNECEIRVLRLGMRYSHGSTKDRGVRNVMYGKPRDCLWLHRIVGILHDLLAYCYCALYVVFIINQYWLYIMICVQFIYQFLLPT